MKKAAQRRPGNGLNGRKASGLEHEVMMRRETGREQLVKVQYDEGIANHIGPEPCAGIRENVGEASAGERIGQPLSRDRKAILGADAVPKVEGNTLWRALASAAMTRRGRRTWHARTLHVREPGDLQIGHRPHWAEGPRREGEEP